MRVLLCVLLGLTCLTSLGCVSEEAKLKYQSAAAEAEAALAEYKGLVDELKQLKVKFDAGELDISKAQLDVVVAMLEEKTGKAWDKSVAAREKARDAWKEAEEGGASKWSNVLYGAWAIVLLPLLRGLNIPGFRSGTGKSWVTPAGGATPAG